MLHLEGGVVLCIVQAQRSQVALLPLHTLLTLVNVPLLHLGEQIKQLLNLTAVLLQQLPSLLARNTLDLLKVLVEELLHLVVPVAQNVTLFHLGTVELHVPLCHALQQLVNVLRLHQESLANKSNISKQIKH